MSASKKITYSEFSNKRTQSTLWNHFLRADDGQSAKCRLCLKILKTGGGATTALHTHLRAVHNIIDNQNPAENASSSNTTNTSTSTSVASKSAPVPSKKTKLTDFFPSEDSRETIISRMAALDGISYRLFCTSEDLRRLFRKSGYVLPDSPATVSSIVVKHADLVKKQVIKEIAELKASGNAFAISLDEWTSLRMKRYMNVNLHNSAFGGFGFKNLGLVKINGSMPAEVALKLLSDHLLTFEVSLQEDVVSQTTDGASVMIKLGRYFEGFHQLCLAHCIQLAIIDTLYKIQEAPEVPVPDNTENEENSDSDREDDDEGHDDRFEIEISSVQAEPVGHFKYLVEKVRSLVRSFRNSTLKRDALQAYVKKEIGHPQELQLDCRTRWSTMSEMIGVFLKLKDSVRKVMIDMKLDFPLTEQEIESLTEIHRNLEVVKITVNALCRREATLLTADTALRFMLKKIEENHDSLSINLAYNLRKRIKERRLSKITGTLHYLHDCEDFFSAREDDTFIKPNNEQISETVVDILKRLKHRESNLSLSSSTESPREMNVPQLRLSVAEQLELELSKCKNNKQNMPPANLDLDGFVRVEKAIYDNGGCRGQYLTEAYHYLLCILPTSVESERAFSAAGSFCTKLRSSLSDKSLNALSFLKTYYQDLRSRKK